MRTSMQARESASPLPVAELPGARGWGDAVPGASAGRVVGGMLPGVGAAPVQRSATGGVVIQRGRKGKDGGGGGNGRRQGKKSQRDKKYGFMNDPEHGQEFIAWLHALKQKTRRRHDFDAKEVRQLEAQFKAERGIVSLKQRWRPEDEASGSDTDEETGDDLLSEHPEKNPAERSDEEDDDDDSGGGLGGGISGAQQVAVTGS